MSPQLYLRKIGRARPDWFSVSMFLPNGQRRPCIQRPWITYRAPHELPQPAASGSHQPEHARRHRVWTVIDAGDVDGCAENMVGWDEPCDGKSVVGCHLNLRRRLASRTVKGAESAGGECHTCG